MSVDDLLFLVRILNAHKMDILLSHEAAAEDLRMAVK